MKRRTLLVATGLATTSRAWAQSWPDRPIRIIVPFPAGGSVDVLTRVLAEPLSKRLGQLVVVENRAGAGGNIGSEAASRAAPDGYTLVVATIGVLAINRHIYSRLSFDPKNDFVPISYLWDIGNILVVPASSPWHSVADLVAAGKEKGQLTYGTPGNGTSDHMASALFIMRAGIEAQHVPYRGGGPAVLTDLMAGRISFSIGNLPSYITGIRGGGLRALAVANATRWPTPPDVPTLTESGVPDVVLPSWSGMLGPKGLPDAIRDRLAAEVMAILAAPEFRNRVQEAGGQAVGTGPDGLTAQIVREDARYADLAQRLQLRVD